MLEPDNNPLRIQSPAQTNQNWDSDQSSAWRSYFNDFQRVGWKIAAQNLPSTIQLQTNKKSENCSQQKLRDDFGLSGEPIAYEPSLLARSAERAVSQLIKTNWYNQY